MLLQPIHANIKNKWTFQFELGLRPFHFEHNIDHLAIYKGEVVLLLLSMSAMLAISPSCLLYPSKLSYLDLVDDVLQWMKQLFHLQCLLHLLLFHYYVCFHLHHFERMHLKEGYPYQILMNHLSRIRPPRTIFSLDVELSFLAILKQKRLIGN